MRTGIDTAWNHLQKLALGLVVPALAGLAACGNPGGPVAGSPDVSPADAEIAEQADDAGLDADTGPSDTPLDVAVFQMDCASPQSPGCPCSKIEGSCCIGPSYGLECELWKNPPTWSTFSDCCRGNQPGCNYPNPPRPWCNGKAP